MALFNILLDFVTAGLFSQYLLSKAPLGFQMAASPSFYNIIEFHDYIIVFLVFIFLIVLWHLVWAINLSKILYPMVINLILLPAIVPYFTNQWVLFKQNSGVYSSENIIIEKKNVLEFLKIYTPEEAKIMETMLSLIYPYCFDENKNNNIFALKVLLFLLFILFILENTKQTTSIFALLNTNEILAENFVYLQYRHIQNQLRRLTHAPRLEIIWTIFPSFILLAIAIPSLILLYQLDNVEPISLCIKVIGHQWYWTYEIGISIPLFSDLTRFSQESIPTSFDSYMLSEELSNLRLLEVDNPLFVPVDMPLTFMITSTDVLHSWAVPSLGIKVDAIPGRLNRVGVSVLYTGIFYGQCSELCGVNHGFMPINIYAYLE
jgi:heme/copper-type cytochrome/quinol oxidase subunit 2